MDVMNLADLQDQIPEMIERVDAGKSVDLVRNGRPFARISPIAEPLGADRPPIDWERVFAFTKTLPFDPTPTGEFIRRMRNDARY